MNQVCYCPLVGLKTEVFQVLMATSNQIQQPGKGRKGQESEGKEIKQKERKGSTVLWTNLRHY